MVLIRSFVYAAILWFYVFIGSFSMPWPPSLSSKPIPKILGVVVDSFFLSQIVFPFREVKEIWCSFTSLMNWSDNSNLTSRLFFKILMLVFSLTCWIPCIRQQIGAGSTFTITFNFSKNSYYIWKWLGKLFIMMDCLINHNFLFICIQLLLNINV